MRRVLKKSGQRGKAIRRNHKPLIRVQEKPSVFNLRAQRNAFRRRDARQLRRLFARKNPRLRRGPKSGFAEIVSDDFPVLHLRWLNRQKLAF